MPERLPWEVVETFPSADADQIAYWSRRVADSADDGERSHALVGHALATYWSVQEGHSDLSLSDSQTVRQDEMTEALARARAAGDPDVLATALLGWLYALWGPDQRNTRAGVVSELVGLYDQVGEEELRLRIHEWVVLGHLDAGDIDAARRGIRAFSDEAASTALVAFRRREELWEANIAMLVGRIDESVAMNQDAIASTADTAGSPFSFQNVAITLAIERFLRRGLVDLVDAIRSIRASSPRVAANWDTGLAFALIQSGGTEEAAELFEVLAADDFVVVPRDLNWLVTMQLLALVALDLDDRFRLERLLELLEPFAALDATHGSGYASYGPVGRVVGSLAARLGLHDRAARSFELVLNTRAPGPWTSLTRLDRARARRDVDPILALADATAAETELTGLAMAEWAAAARRLRGELLLEGHGPPTALRRSETWTLRRGADSAGVADSVGVRQLMELLVRPGMALESIELDTRADPSLPKTATLDAGLDEHARVAYRRRLVELDDAPQPLTEHEAAEADLIRRQLAGAAFAASGSVELERARVRVTKSLRRAIETISAQSAPLGRHLADTVSTGRQCLYAPTDARAWEVLIET